MIDYKALALGVMIPLGLVASLPALAQEADARPDPFSMMDTDGDGALSLEEMQAGPQGGFFANADADGDGQITRDEMMARATEQATQRIDQFFERVDGDEDGVVTEAEIAAAREARENERRVEMAARIFDRMDADGDGTISPEEFAEARDRIGERSGRGEGRGFFGHRG